jgi:hypothetical protein
MAKSFGTIAASCSGVLAMVFSLVAPDAPASARFAFVHGGGGFGRTNNFFRGPAPGAGYGPVGSNFVAHPGGHLNGDRPTYAQCGFVGPCAGRNSFRPPRYGFGHGTFFAGEGPWVYGAAAGLDMAPPYDPGDDPPPGMVASADEGAGAQASGPAAALAKGEQRVRQFSEAARMALGRCPLVRWPEDQRALDEADLKRLHCVSDVLTVYADELQETAPLLPQKMRTIPAVLKTAAKKVAAAKTKAEAVSAVATATAEVHKTLALLKADDPVLRSVGTREGAQIAQTLDVAEQKLQKAVGL